MLLFFYSYIVLIYNSLQGVNVHKEYFSMKIMIIKASHLISADQYEDLKRYWRGAEKRE